MSAENEEDFPPLDVSSFVIRGGRYLPGWFYAIQLDPLREASRLKLGFSRNIPKRLKTYRTVYPDAKVIECWECSSTTVEKDVLFLLEDGGKWFRQGKSEVFDLWGAKPWDINAFLDEVARNLNGVENQEEGFMREAGRL